MVLGLFLRTARLAVARVEWVMAVAGLEGMVETVAPEGPGRVPWVPMAITFPPSVLAASVPETVRAVVVVEEEQEELASQAVVVVAQAAAARVV